MAKSGSTTKTLVWVLMGMLILGLGGFGVTNLSGSVRSIGTVGDKDIPVNLYARALQEEIRAIEAETKQGLNFEQVQAMGLDRAVLARVIATRALDYETSRLGLSIGDENLALQIRDIAAFRGVDGKFDRENYAFSLSQAGLSEAEFETQLREETTRSLLQGAVVSGTAMPPAYADTLLAYIGERRNFTWARMDESDLPIPLPEPTEEMLQAYHAANPQQFSLPEGKRITYVWLTPEMIIDTVEVDEAALREQYDLRKDEYNQPERRLVERLGFADTAAAEAALARITAGEITFDALVTERGLEMSDVDLGDTTEAALGAAGATVFAAAEGSVSGPFDTQIGPALFRVNGILPAQNTTYEEALPELRDEIASDRARRVIEGRIDEIDNLLAGGATLEEVAKESELRLGQIDWDPQLGIDIAAYNSFRDAAVALTIDEFPRVLQLDDGGIFAMRLDEELPERVQSYAISRDQVAAAWQSAEVRSRLRSHAEALLPQLGVIRDMASLGLTATVETGITRSDYILGTPTGFLTEVFAMKMGELKVIDSFGTVLIVRLDGILPPDAASEEVSALRQILNDQAEQAISQDLFQALANDIRTRAGITLDQQALNAVHASFR